MELIKKLKEKMDLYRHTISHTTWYKTGSWMLDIDAKSILECQYAACPAQDWPYPYMENGTFRDYHKMLYAKPIRRNSNQVIVLDEIGNKTDSHRQYDPSAQYDIHF